MELLLIFVVLLIICGGLGGYHFYGAGGPGPGLLPIVLLVLVLLIIFGGGFGYYHRYW